MRACVLACARAHVRVQSKTISEKFSFVDEINGFYTFSALACLCACVLACLRVPVRTYARSRAYMASTWFSVLACLRASVLARVCAQSCVKDDHVKSFRFSMKINGVRVCLRACACPCARMRTVVELQRPLFMVCLRACVLAHVLACWRACAYPCARMRAVVRTIM